MKVGESRGKCLAPKAPGRLGTNQNEPPPKAADKNCWETDFVKFLEEQNHTKMSKVTYCHIGTHITCQVRTVWVGLVVHDLEIFSLGGPTVEVDWSKLWLPKSYHISVGKFF